MQKIFFVIGILLFNNLCIVAYSQWNEPFPGNPPICPRWAFEPWVWEDNVNTQTSTENLVKGYLDRNIPVGAVIIDSPWESYYNTLEWDETRYPNGQQMIQDFHDKGVKVILWITGFINTNSPDYSYVKIQNYVVDNGTDHKWWKGKGVHLDFTNEDARNWWHVKLDNVLSQNIDGWKVDCSADALFNSVLTSIGTMPRQQFKKYYYADFYDYSINKNPEAITAARAYSYQGGTGAPISKSPISWHGDYSGDFPGLNEQKNNVYESALLGYGAPGVEVGGFSIIAPTKHSLIRYAQFGAMTPLMNNGGANGGLAEHLPWYWDEEAVDIYRYYATLHSELVPYMFSYGVDAHLTGKSILRFVEKQHGQHKLGEDILVSIFTSNDTAKQVIFPDSAKWIDYWDDSKVYKAKKITNYHASLDKFPIFIRAGAIIPMNVQNSVTNHGDSSYRDKIVLYIYPCGESQFNFHMPTGDGIEYKDVFIAVNEEDGTIDIRSDTIVDYRLCVKSFSVPCSVSGADNWGYDLDSKFIIMDKSGLAFRITVNEIYGYFNFDRLNSLLTISGKVCYYSNNQPVKNVSFNLNGSNSRTTDDCGNYLFSSLISEKNYTVTSATSQDSSETTIITYDAALTARFALGLENFNNDQQIAADVDLDNNVLVYDAALIARYAVGLGNISNSHVGEWTFNPETRSYLNLQENKSNENYTAYILGDVDGNWSSQVLLSKNEFKVLMTSRLQKDIYITSDTLNSPFYMGKNSNLISFDLEMDYDQAAYKFIGFEKSMLANSLKFISNVKNGKIKLGAYGINPINQSGKLFTLKFLIEGEIGNSDKIDLKRFQINNGDIEKSSFQLERENQINNPNSFEVISNYPNPFNSSVSIHFYIREDEIVKITIFNQRGEMVNEILNSRLQKGYHTYHWDGTNKEGFPVSSGVYFFNIRYKNINKSIKVMLIR